MQTPGGDPSGQPKSVGEDPPAAVDETSTFVLDAFEQFNSDGEQYDLPAVAPPPQPEPTEAATPPPVQTTQVTAPPVGTTPPAVAPAAPPAPVALTGTVAQQPPVVAAPSPAPPAAASPAPVAAPAPAASPAVDPAAIQPGDFAAIAEGLQRNIGVFQKKLEQTEYQLSREEKEALGLDESQAAGFAALAAKVHVNAVGTIMRTMAQQLPAMMSKQLELRDSARRAEDSFFEAWPELKAHKQTVEQLAVAYRGTNPRATQEEFTRMVGSWAMTALGLQRQAAAAPAAAPPQSQVRTPGTVVRAAPAPFAPAGAATAPNGTAPAAPNPWEQGANWLLSDDSGHFDT